MERGLEIISEGDLNYRVPVVRKDELGRVAFNINLMAERLQQQIVKERELESSKMEMMFVQNTYNKAVHLKKMPDVLFEYTRLTSVETRLDLKKIDIFQLLDQLLFEFEPIAQESGIHIIELHGGTLTLHHTNNLFKFTLTLPLEGAPASANPVWDP